MNFQTYCDHKMNEGDCNQKCYYCKDEYLNEIEQDLDKVRKQLSEAIEVIKFYGERSNWYSRYGESDGIIKNDSVDNYSQRAGGRQAREFLKSLEEE